MTNVSKEAKATVALKIFLAVLGNSRTIHDNPKVVNNLMKDCFRWAENWIDVCKEEFESDE